MTRELVNEPQVVHAQKGKHEAAAHALDPSVAAMIGLQQSAGNSVVARVVAEGAPALGLARKGDGWSDARPGGWNEKTRHVGKTERIPLEGLSGGLADDDKRKTSSEGAAHKAIAIVPDAVDWSKPVEVLLHFHGFGSGYRESTEKNQETPAGAVRDVEESEIEQQLVSTGRSMVAILPQGTSSSVFSVADPAAYVGEAFKKMLDHLVIAANPKPGRIVVSGHSGGGVAATSSAKALQAQAGADEGQWLAASPLFLFDAINGTGELANVRKLLDGWLAEDIKILSAAGPRAAELVGKRGVSGVATRVATDKDIQDELRSTINELRKAADRVQGKTEHKRSGGFLLFVGIVLGVLFNPVTGPQTRKFISDRLFGGGDDFTYEGGSGNGSATS